MHVMVHVDNYHVSACVGESVSYLSLNDYDSGHSTSVSLIFNNLEGIDKVIEGLVELKTKFKEYVARNE